ncbi:hypothetical protein ABIB82_000304 [Bradyrhizobium sp. i1.8.4]|uniref:hypothetical protein n=1 Tax=unclassified Bradyrhizobium TaxID=2631580 RepID=UPI003D1D8A1A
MLAKFANNGPSSLRAAPPGGYSGLCQKHFERGDALGDQREVYAALRRDTRDEIGNRLFAAPSLHDGMASAGCATSTEMAVRHAGSKT